MASSSSQAFGYQRHTPIKWARHVVLTPLLVASGAKCDFPKSAFNLSYYRKSAVLTDIDTEFEAK